MTSYLHKTQPMLLRAIALSGVLTLGAPGFVSATDYQAVNGTITCESAADALVARSDYSWPPRCGPRNCVAACVTCLYDICRSSGGSVEQCNAQKELCKQSCAEKHLEDCPTGDPFCDFK